MAPAYTSMPPAGEQAGRKRSRKLGAFNDGCQNVAAYDGVAKRPTDIPLRISGVDGKGVLGYELTITYDPSILEVRGVAREGGLSAGWMVLSNQRVPGRLKILGYGVGPLQGNGMLLNLTVAARGPQGSSSPLIIERLVINEGLAATGSDGGLTVGPPLPTIYLPALRR